MEETRSDPLHLLTFTPIHNLTLHIYIFRRINVAPYLIPHRLQRILQAALAFLSFADQTSLCYLSSVSVGQNRNPHLVPSAPFHQNLSKTIPSCHWAHCKWHRKLTRCARFDSHCWRVDFNGNSRFHSGCDHIGFFLGNICDRARDNLSSHKIGNCDWWGV